MVSWLNQMSTEWLRLFGLVIIQNTLFLVIVILLLKWFRSSNIRFLRWLALLGVIKLIIPPIRLPFDFLQSATPVTFSSQAVMTMFSVPEPTSGSVIVSLPSILMIAWFAMACIFFALMLYRVWTLIRIRFHAVPVNLPDFLPEDSRVRIWSSSEVSSPMALGLFRPHILVPDHWEHYSPSTKQAIIQHELAHLKQYDPLIAVLQIVATAAYFFHPLVWMLNKRLNHYSELICDNAAVTQTSLDSRTYLQSIVEVAEWNRSGRVLQALPGFAGSYKYLRERVSYQMKHGNRGQTTLGWKHLFILGLAGMLMIPLSCEIQNDNRTSVTPSLAGNTTTQDTQSGLRIRPPQPVGGLAALQQAVTYPQLAEEVGVEGTIVARIFLDENGKVDDVELIQRIPKTGMDEAVIEAIQNVEWQPGTVNNEPAGMEYTISIVFQIGDAGIEVKEGLPDRMLRVRQ